MVEHYDRILSLVESEQLRQRAGDFRDVGTRLLRNVDDNSGGVAELPRPDGRYILAAARLNTADMFDLLVALGANDEQAPVEQESRHAGHTTRANLRLTRQDDLPDLVVTDRLPHGVGASGR